MLMSLTMNCLTNWCKIFYDYSHLKVSVNYQVSRKMYELLNIRLGSVAGNQ